MLSTTYHRIAVKQTIASVLLLLLLLTYDVILDILLSGLNMIYELVGTSAEELVQYLFHTDHRESEIVVIYVFFFILLYALYRFIRALPGLTRRFKRNISLRWARKKTRIARYWRTFSSFQKVKIVTFYSVCTCVLMTWLFFL